MEYALSGAVFEKSGIELSVWLMAICLMVNVKKSLSSRQLSLDLEGNQQAAWQMQQRIRAAMASEPLPAPPGIVEADGIHIGGNHVRSTKITTYPPPPPRKIREAGKPPKARVIGAVERGGKVIACGARDLTGKGVPRLVKDSLETEGSLLISGEFKPRRAVRPLIYCAVIHHSAGEAGNAAPGDQMRGGIPYPRMRMPAQTGAVSRFPPSWLSEPGFLVSLAGHQRSFPTAGEISPAERVQAPTGSFISCTCGGPAQSGKQGTAQTIH